MSAAPQVRALGSGAMGSDSGARLLIDSATGVDVQLRIAGPGARAFAFTFDWHVRLVLAGLWFAGAAILYNHGMRFTASAPRDPLWLGAVVAPALGIYYLYHCVLEVALRGRTPGKRTAGIRIATRQGGTPSAGQLLARNVFRLIDGLPGFYSVGLLCTLATREQVRIGDLAAGTVVVYEPAATVRPLALPATARVHFAQAELVSELLQRWTQLGPGARERLARELLVDCGERVPEGVPLRSRLEELARESA